MIAPAAIMIVLFFLMPVVLTAVFSMTNMSTATGISGGAYQVAPSRVNRLRDDMPEIASAIAEPRYVIDEAAAASRRRPQARAGHRRGTARPDIWARSSLPAARPSA